MRALLFLSTKRNSFAVYLVTLGIILFFTLKAQTFWVSGAVNLFNRELLRVWPMEPVELAQTFCSPANDLEAVQGMTTLLENSASDQDPALVSRQGQLACLEGNLQEAQAAWRQVSKTSVPQPAALLLLVSSLFAQGQVIETPLAFDVGHYGFLRGLDADREDDVSKAADWYRFSLTYAPVVNTANYLARLYRSQGGVEQVKAFWLGLTQTTADDTSLYWWAKAEAAEAEQEWLAAGDYYNQSAQRGDTAEAYRAFVEAGMMWYRAEAYEQAQTAFQEALLLEVNYETMDLDEVAPYLWLGKTAFAEEHYEKALDYYAQALMVDAVNSGTLYERAVTLHALGHRAEAINVLTEAITYHPNPPQPWETLLKSWQQCPNEGVGFGC